MEKHLTVLFAFLFLCCGMPSLNAQEDTLTIALVTDDKDPSEDFQRAVQEEITTLLKNRFVVAFEFYSCPCTREDLDAEVTKAYQNPETDIVIGLGALMGGLLAQRGDFPKPTIASIILDKKLQQIPEGPAGSSGIHNFTYVESPFDIERDLKALYRIYPFQKIAVIGERNIQEDLAFITELWSTYVEGLNASFEFIDIKENIAATVDAIPDDADAVYVLPLFLEEANVAELFRRINGRGIPSAALMGEAFLGQGALLAYEFEKNFQRMPRRIALNVLKIAEGTDPANLPVKMESYNENLLINMATAREIEIYPDWDMMAEATLININKIPAERMLTLKGAIAEALSNNLDLKVAEAGLRIVEKDVALAKAELLPQVDVSTTLALYDKNTALTYQGGQGRLNWLAGGSISQLIYSEPALANVTIQKLLKKSEEYALTQTQLDVILDVAAVYLNVLQAQSNLLIQQENVAVTKENYDISKVKNAVGYSGASDLNRWIAELALKNIDLNDANVALQQAKFQLNQLLNRPIKEAFNIEEASLDNQMLLITDDRMRFINNEGELANFADFLCTDMMKGLPELNQLNAGVDVQERLALSRRRAFYNPAIALSGSANRVLQKFEVPEPLTPLDNVTTWNLGMGVQYPIFQGGSRKHALEQARLNVLQLEHQRANTNNQLEVFIRSNMATVGASYARVQLSRKAAEASRKNFTIVQNAYSEGQANVTTLIDAQNNAIQTELVAVTAVYNFILDFLTLERSIGFYYFMATPAEQDEFFQRLNTFLLQQD